MTKSRQLDHFCRGAANRRSSRADSQHLAIDAIVVVADRHGAAHDLSRRHRETLARRRCLLLCPPARLPIRCAFRARGTAGSSAMSLLVMIGEHGTLAAVIAVTTSFTVRSEIHPRRMASNSIPSIDSSCVRAVSHFGSAGSSPITRSIREYTSPDRAHHDPSVGSLKAVERLEALRAISGSARARCRSGNTQPSCRPAFCESLRTALRRSTGPLPVVRA